MKTNKETTIKEVDVLEFESRDAETLYFTNDDLKYFCRVTNGNRSTIVSFNNCIGAFNIKGHTYRIESKINEFTRIFEMFQKVILSEHSFKSPKKLYYFDSSNLVNIKAGSHFNEILISIFLNEVTKISRLGFSKTYTQKRENTRFLKGRLMINQQIKKNIVQDKFFCQYNELTHETKENLILYSVLQKLIYRPINFTEKSKIIYFSQSVFNEMLNIHEPLDDVAFDYTKNRQNMHYELAIKLAEIIYHQQGVNSQEKGTNMFCNFAIKMDVLYEQYVFLLLKEALEEYWPHLKVVEQYTLHHIINRSRSQKHINFLDMYPDIVIIDKRSNEPVLVVDTKYKDLEKKNKLQNVDYYQIFTYAQSLTYEAKCTLPVKGVLLTHGTSGNQYEFPTPQGTFYFYTEAIDVRNSEEEMKQQIVEILAKVLK